MNEWPEYSCYYSHCNRALDFPLSAVGVHTAQVGRGGDCEDVQGTAAGAEQQDKTNTDCCKF